MFSLAPRWRKVLRDLVGKNNKALLAILAIALGVFAFGTVINAYSILIREINLNYQNTNPESAIIYVDDASPDLIQKVQDLPNVEVATARRLISGHILVGENASGNDWQATRIFVVNDFNNLDLTKISSESGAWPPSSEGLIIERSSAALPTFPTGQNITIKTTSGATATLQVEGVSFDAAQAPGWQDGLNYVYITPAALKNFGLSPTLNEVLVRVAKPNATRDDINLVTKEIEALIQSEGQEVSGVLVRTPGKHPHSDQMNSLMLLFQVFSLLTLVLAAVLSATTLNAILGKQIREIGVMKALGANTKQISTMYVVMVLIMSTVALAISLVPAVWVARAFATSLAELLNFNITDNSIPLEVFAIQILTAFAMPLIATVLPIFKTTGITVKNALNNYGISTTNNSAPKTNLFSNLPFNRPLLMSIRNTFRKRIRLILTIGILALSGATFMSALFVQAAWKNTIIVAQDAIAYDLNVTFSQAYPDEVVQTALATIDNIDKVESWGQVEAVNIEKGNFDGLRFRINAVPENTEMINFPILKGRWLSSDSAASSTKEIVINHEFLFEYPVKVGEQLNLGVDGKEDLWTVVGIVKELAPGRNRYGSAGVGYISLNDYYQMARKQGITSNLRISFKDTSPVATLATMRQLEQQFSLANLQIFKMLTSSERLQILEDHLVVIVSLLLGMAVFTAVVGSFALISTMSLIVMERSKELGVMRAIGASTPTILSIVTIEGLVISFLGFLASLTLAWPITVAAGDAAGNIFVRSGLNYIIPIYVPLFWLGLAFLIGLGASLPPAIQAARAPVKDVLAFE